MDNRLLILILEKVRKGEIIGHHAILNDIRKENRDYEHLSQDEFRDAINYLMRIDCIRRHRDPTNYICYEINPSKDCILMITRHEDNDTIRNVPIESIDFETHLHGGTGAGKGLSKEETKIARQREASEILAPKGIKIVQKILLWTIVLLILFITLWVLKYFHKI